MPWVLCRVRNTLGTFVNYFDRQYHHPSPLIGKELAMFCYSLNSLFGPVSSIEHSSVYNWTVGAQAIIHAWVQSNHDKTVLFNLCTDLEHLLKKLPRIKHDVEICNWDKNQLHGRLLDHWLQLKHWYAEARYQKTDDASRQYLATLTCLILKNLKYVLIASKPEILSRHQALMYPTKHSSSSLGSTLSRFDILLLGNKHLTTEIFTTVTYLQCEEYIGFDWYFWSPSIL